MNRKNKAARAVNVALGLIVILAVIVSSPLFGYAKGFSTPEQRAAEAERETQTEVYLVPPVTATPRPTPKPTPTPVILPSAPPTVEPTPQNTPRTVYTPAPQVQPQQNAAPVQQAVWTPEPVQEDWEENWEEESGEDASDGGFWGDTGASVSQNEDGSQYIQNDNFDLIFSDQSSGSTAQTVVTQDSVAVDYSGGQEAFSASDFQQDAREGWVMSIE